MQQQQQQQQQQQTQQHQRPRFIAAGLSALAIAAGLAWADAARAVEFAQPDEALVHRYEQHPDELAARVRECDALGIADAVASVVCVSTKEVRYRRERAALRTAAAPAPAARPAVVVQTAAYVSKPALVAAGGDAH